MEKTIKIIPPEGYEVDKEKSTFSEIVFKKLEPNLPMSWEELGVIEGCYISVGSDISLLHRANAIDTNRNIFPTKEEAIAMRAIAQLCQLRDRWNGGWKPDWKDDTRKHCIILCDNILCKEFYYNTSTPMTFKTRELRDKFMETFKDLLEEAKPFL